MINISPRSHMASSVRSSSAQQLSLPGMQWRGSSSRAPVHAPSTPQRVWRVCPAAAAAHSEPPEPQTQQQQQQQLLDDTLTAVQTEDMPRPPSTADCDAEARMYVALAAGLAAAGIVAVACVAPLSAASLPLHGLEPSQAALLLGCCGAGLLRASSLALFLAGGAAAGEQGSWRYQRINLGLATTAAAAGVVQLLGLVPGAASPWVPVLSLTGCVAVAAGCGWALRQQLARGGMQFASALRGTAGPVAGAVLLVRHALRDVSTLAGGLLAALCLVCAAAGVAGYASALVGGGAAASLSSSAAASALAGPLPAPLAAACAGAQASLLRYMSGCLAVGALLTALQCAALGEVAAHARGLDPLRAARVLLLGAAECEVRAAGWLQLPVTLPPGRAAPLQAGLLLAGAVQAAALSVGGGVGPATGSALAGLSHPLLAGSLVWTVLGSGAYAVVLAARADYGSLLSALLGVASRLSGLVSGVAVLIYTDWTWLQPARRR